LGEDRGDLQPGRVRGRQDERHDDEQEQQPVAIVPARLRGRDRLVRPSVFARHARTVLRHRGPSEKACRFDTGEAADPQSRDRRTDEQEPSMSNVAISDPDRLATVTIASARLAASAGG
jgi:hypothetical protein